MRIHYFDNLRVVASIFAVFYHVGEIFRHQPWLINVEPQYTNETIGNIIQYLNISRMPIFMFLSGYFVFISVNKYKKSKFIFKRVYRILLPFLFGIFLIKPIQDFFTVYFYHPDNWQVYFINIINPLCKTFVFHHLWFLYHIFIYSLLILFTREYLSHLLKHKIDQAISFINNHPVKVILFWATFLYGFQILGQQAQHILHNLNESWFPIDLMTRHLPIFLLGYYSGKQNNSFLKKTITGNRTVIISLGFVYLSLIIIHNFTAESFSWYIWELLKLTALLFVLNLFKLYFNYTNKVLTYLSDASYPFYILHLPIVIMLGFFYIRYVSFINSLTFYFIYCLSAIFITDLVYQLFVKSNRTGMFLLTGMLKDANKRYTRLINNKPKAA